jgi:hypothetical protein
MNYSTVYRTTSPADKERILKHVDDVVAKSQRFADFWTRLCENAEVRDDTLHKKVGATVNKLARFWKVGRICPMFDPLQAATLYFTSDTVGQYISSAEFSNMTPGHFRSVLEDMHRVTGRLLESHTTVTQTGAEITEWELLHRYTIMYSQFVVFMKRYVFTDTAGASLSKDPLTELVQQLESQQGQPDTTAPVASPDSAAE